MPLTFSRKGPEEKKKGWKLEKNADCLAAEPRGRVHEFAANLCCYVIGDETGGCDELSRGRSRSDAPTIPGSFLFIYFFLNSWLSKSMSLSSKTQRRNVFSQPSLEKKKKSYQRSDFVVLKNWKMCCQLVAGIQAPYWLPSSLYPASVLQSAPHRVIALSFLPLDVYTQQASFIPIRKPLAH